MKRALALGAVTGLMAFGIAPAAHAGEVTGSTNPRAPQSTPVQGWIAASICAFSGLEDYSEGQEIPESGPQAVQNWGHEPMRTKAAGKTGMTPGLFCNPNTVFPE